MAAGVAHVGRKRDDPDALRGRNDKRKELISNSRYSETVLKSQQTCSVLENRRKLDKLIEKAGARRENHRDRLLGLREVWDQLNGDTVGVDGKECNTSFLQFEEAIDVFYSFYRHIQRPYLNTDRDKFLYSLLHNDWGLCIYVVTLQETNSRLIVIRPDNFDMERFLHFVSLPFRTRLVPRLKLDKCLIHSILDTLGSEWDRIVARVLLGVDKSREQLEELGINDDDISKNIQKVILLMSLKFSKHKFITMP